MTTVDKKDALRGWAGKPEEQNRLFFQARNLAIEALCLQLENRFLRAGLLVRAEWKESSFSSVSLRLTLENPKKGQSWEEKTVSLVLKRGRISAPSHLSDCFYEYQGSMLDGGGRQPALLTQLVEQVRELEATGVIHKMVLRVNYPFDYKALSVY